MIIQTRSYTSESVTEGHPDKLCDLIADSILDAHLRYDQHTRMACEVMATQGKIIVAGEITCSKKLDIKPIVKGVLNLVGYNSDLFDIIILVHEQSSEISNCINCDDLGAGDQGTIYGFATDETPECLPLPVVLSHNITRNLDKARHTGLINFIKPDGKCQVTVEYKNGTPQRVKTIVVSIQHDKKTTIDFLKSQIMDKILIKSFECFPFDNNTEMFINPSGSFTIGGPEADTGLTGRKIMVDTYGGIASHGGGAFSGKDATKVDRSGAYMARYVAKHIVKSGLAKKCELNICYVIGKSNPVDLTVNTFDTGIVCDDILRRAILGVFDFKPASIINTLGLNKPIFTKSTLYGHFGDKCASWETVDKCESIRKYIRKLF